MKWVHIFIFATALAAFPFSVKAQESACPEECICLTDHAAKPSLWYFNGYAESGLYVNQYGQKNTYTSPRAHGPDWWGGNTGMLQNVHHADYQLNQLFMACGKKLDTTHGWDIGGRVELMFGTDAVFMQSMGLDSGWATGDYYTAISQMYAEIGYKTFSVKVGKFDTIIGYEPIDSTQRFFYSLSHSYGLNPATHSGVLATWMVDEQLVVFGGWVNGEETFFDTSKNNAFLGGAQYTFSEKLYVRYATMNGHDTSMGDGRTYWVQSIVVGFRPAERWSYAFEWIYRDNGVGELLPFFEDRNIGGRYGINQELIYTYTEKLAFGFRFEWVYGALPAHDLASLLDNTNESKFAITIAANWKPTKWLIVKPEIRYDRYEHSEAFNIMKGTPSKDQISGGFSTTLVF